jgi:hypothetical protein
VSADDLRVVAEHGYEGAASADHDQQAQGGPQFAAFIPPYPDLADFPLSADVFTAEAVLVPLLSPLPTSELDPMLRDCAGEYRHRSG